MLQTIYLVSSGNWDQPNAWSGTAGGAGSITNPQNGGGTTYVCDLNGRTVLLNVPVVVDSIRGGAVNPGGQLVPAALMSNVTATSGPGVGEITIQWSPFPGAIYYIVNALDENGNVSSIGQTDATFLRWTAPLSSLYQFSVVAHTEAGDFSYVVKPVSGPRSVAEIAQAILHDQSTVDGKTLTQAIKIIAAVLAGKVTGAGTGTETFVGLDGVTTRVVVTADAFGNRSEVRYDDSDQSNDPPPV